MTKKQREVMNFLKHDHFGLWIRTRAETEEILSFKQKMWCCCGKLATGLHERTCRKFQNMVNTETIKTIQRNYKIDM